MNKSNKTIKNQEKGVIMNITEEKKRAERYAYRYHEALTYAGHTTEDFAYKYLEVLQTALKNYNKDKGNLGQFCSGVLKNTFMGMTKKNKKSKGCQFIAIDDILASYRSNYEVSSDIVETDTTYVKTANHETKTSFLDCLQHQETMKWSGLARIDIDCYLEIAEEVFKKDSLAHKIFLYRFFANHNVKRTELAKVFNVTVEKVRWTEKQIASKASKFDLPTTKKDA